MTDPFACMETGCHYLTAGTLDECEKVQHCPFAHQRRREENRLDQERKDAAREAE